jgi:signal transduction histidine kinase
VGREDERDFTDEDQEMLRLFAAQAAIAIGNARMHRAAVRHGQQMDALLRSMRTMLDDLEFQPTLERILAEASRITGSLNVKVLLLERERGVLRLSALQGVGGMERDHVLRLGEGLSGIVAQTGQPLQVSRTQADPRNPYRSRDALLGIDHFLGLPIRVHDAVVGVLAFSDGPRPVYAPEEIAYLTSFADQAAIAIENARLFRSVQEQHTQLRQLWRRLSEVEESERRRLSRELHDRVGQNLTALSLNLSILDTLARSRPEDPLGERLADSQALVQETVECIRSVMAELRPPVLDDYGLSAALRWLGEHAGSRLGIPVDVRAGDLPTRIPRAVETVLFRIAQEALTNVAKHARAGRIGITLESRHGRILLAVVDDGCGFDLCEAARVSAPHWGLLSMRERVEALGGSFRIESAPGRGTRVVVELAQE